MPASFEGCASRTVSTPAFLDLDGDLAVEIFPGITARLLWQGENGAKAAVTTIAPGAVWGDEDHHSPGSAEVYVVSGVLNDGVNDYPAGTFLHAPAGSWHIPQSASGCVLFLFYPEG